MRPLGRLRGSQTCGAGEPSIGNPAAWDPSAQQRRAGGCERLVKAYSALAAARPPLSKRAGRALPPGEKQERARKFRSQLNVRIFKITQDAQQALQPGNTPTSVITGEPPPSSLENHPHHRRRTTPIITIRHHRRTTSVITKDRQQASKSTLRRGDYLNLVYNERYFIWGN